MMNMNWHLILIYIFFYVCGTGASTQGLNLEPLHHTFFFLVKGF
jgi:hypothetical protein